MAKMKWDRKRGKPVPIQETTERTPEFSSFGLRSMAVMSGTPTNDWDKEIEVVSIGVDGTPDKASVKLGNRFDHKIATLKIKINEIAKANGMGLDELATKYLFILHVRYGADTFYREEVYYQSSSGYIEYLITNGITKNAGVYSFVLSAAEREEDGLNVNKKEVFISTPFSGVVVNNFLTESFYAFDKNWMETNNDITGIKKSEITLIASEDGALTLQAGSSNNLGVKNDNCVKKINFTTTNSQSFPDEDWGKLIIFHSNSATEANQKIVGIPFEKVGEAGEESYLCWVPDWITQNTGGFETLLMFYKGETLRAAEKIFISNTLAGFNVIDTWITSTAMSTTQYNTKNEEPVQTDDNESFYVRGGNNE